MPPSSTSHVALSVGVAITTRDRWPDLEITLARIRAFPGLADCPLVVMDDASVEPCPDLLLAKFPHVTFVRADTSLGLVAQRNRLAAHLDTALILSLDDDSYPIAGELAGAVRCLAENDDVFCLALNLVGRPDEPPDLPLAAPPFRVRMFIGCGHLMDRCKFLELGGYREPLQLYNEEWELSARAARRGWKVLCYSGLLVCHHRSTVNRRSSHRSYYFARSKTLFALWTLPLSALPLALVLCFTGTLQNLGVRDWLPALRGCLRGWLDGFRQRALRQPFTMTAFRQWRALPWPPSR